MTPAKPETAMTKNELLAEVDAMQKRGLPADKADELRLAILYREDPAFRKAVNDIAIN